jgi:hypothetical protein
MTGTVRRFATRPKSAKRLKVAAANGAVATPPITEDRTSV